MNLKDLLPAEEFLNAARRFPVIDVRSPSEFANGHIPGAVNMPMFSDEERAVVGTIYKKESRNAAILKGFEYVGPKMAGLARDAGGIAVDDTVLVHCWRGGMRSGNMAWLFRTSGLTASVLEGGYKAYRAHFRNQLQTINWNFVVLGGPTGSGKTDVLKALKDMGEQVLDLEGLAHHKGSAFGALGQLPQPTTEQFENNVHEAFMDFDPSRVVWVEGESHSIGRVYVPDLLFDLLLQSPLIMFELERELRLDRLVREYGCFERETLAHSVEKIQKRLGGLRTREALDALEEDNYRKVADIALQYYDKGYANSLSRRNAPVLSINADEDNPEATARKLISVCL